MKASLLLSGWPLVLFIAAEAFLYVSYQQNDGLFHWFLHFFVGASTALLLMAGAMHWWNRSIRHPLLWIFMGHVIAMFPDILWNFLIVTHRPWMDVFLLHISSHFIPGRNWTWYAIFLLCLALYLASLTTIENEPHDGSIDSVPLSTASTISSPTSRLSRTSLSRLSRS